MKITYAVITLIFTVLVSGCANEIKYKEDKDQVKTGLDLMNKEIPKNKALLEFTTNTIEPATLFKQVGDELCNPEKKVALSRVQRQRELTGVENTTAGALNIATLGLLKLIGDPRDNKTPVSHSLHIESGKEIILQSSSNSTTQTGNGWVTKSCGPIFMKFIPEEGQHYKISFINASDKCNAILIKGTDINPTIPNHTRWSCAKGFMGIGGGEIIGLREIK